MQLYSNSNDLKKALNDLKQKTSSIGFVPTMGALHQGHASLIKKSILENEITVVSIFVNPTQFNNKEDLEKYPRTLEADVEIIEKIDSKIIVFNPTIETIYNTNINSVPYDFDGLENEMEGKHRAGHFDGVGTIVGKLFEIIRPNKAYFGEKDFQQLQIIKKLNSKYNYGIEVIGCPIFRESNGLAMSSRNERLSAETREKASIIFKILNDAKTKFGTKSALEITKFVENQFKNSSDFELEYFEIANEKTLKSCKRKNKKNNYRAFIAVFTENIRLIDNISLK